MYAKFTVVTNTTCKSTWISEVKLRALNKAKASINQEKINVKCQKGQRRIAYFDNGQEEIAFISTDRKTDQIK